MVRYRCSNRACRDRGDYVGFLRPHQVHVPTDGTKVQCRFCWGPVQSISVGRELLMWAVFLALCLAVCFRFTATVYFIIVAFVVPMLWRVYRIRTGS